MAPAAIAATLDETAQGEPAMVEFDRDLPLSQLLEDPLVRLVMRSDGVETGELRELMIEMRQRLRAAGRLMGPMAQDMPS